MPRKRSGSTKSAAVNATAEEIKTFVDALTSSDENLRRGVVIQVLVLASAALRSRLADGLVDRLADGSEAIRRQAAMSLVELGGAITAALILRLHKAESEAVRDLLLEVLVRIAQPLPEAEAARLRMDLLIAAGMAAAPGSRPRPRRNRRRPAQTGDGTA